MDWQQKGPIVVAYNERRRLAEMQTKYKHPKRFTYMLGDLVRVQQRQHETRVGRKASRGVFSNEIFVVAQRLATIPHSYRLNAQNGERLGGERLYSPELIRVTKF